MAPQKKGGLLMSRNWSNHDKSSTAPPVIMIHDVPALLFHRLFPPVLFPIWLLYHAILRKSASFVSLSFRGNAPNATRLPARIDQSCARRTHCVTRRNYIMSPFMELRNWLSWNSNKISIHISTCRCRIMMMELDPSSFIPSHTETELEWTSFCEGNM